VSYASGSGGGTFTGTNAVDIFGEIWFGGWFFKSTAGGWDPVVYENAWYVDNFSVSVAPGGCGLGDVDCNGVVDGLDLTAVLTAWETTPGDPLWNPNADLDGNGVVDGLDLTEVISNWTVAAAPAPEEPEPAKPGKRLGNVRKGR
jgi:hypothetical protein